jgi:hypothetical protein
MALSLVLQVTVPAGPLAAQGALATQPPGLVGAPRNLRAMRTPSRVVIDGRLDDSAWATADVARDFIQHSPNARERSTVPTEARLLMDDDAIYVGMRMADTAPQLIAAPVARRDYDEYSDWAEVIIDSYFDRRTAFRFAINPAGIQRDALITGDQEYSEDVGWDAVWSGAAVLDSAGWSAEFRIPLSQLRFSAPDSGPATWGLQFGRHLARRNERSYWAPIVPEDGAFVSRFGTLGGIRIRDASRRVEAVPFTVAQVTRPALDPANPLFSRQSSTATMGADVRLGVGDFTMTATVNPDFGQVEADPSEVNLSGAESAFSERRPFFLEGGNFFAYHMSSVSWLTGMESLIYSRRMGRAPQGDVPDDAVWSDMPSSTRILGALKLSGRTASGWSIGASSVLTDAARAPWIDTSGRRRESVVEPRTHYGALRATRDYRDGDAGIGGVLTTVHRGDGVPSLRSRAIVGGLDGRLRFGQRRYLFSASLLVSRVSGSREAMLETQRSFAHLFQRPDADYLAVDSARTHLTGMLSEIRLNRIGGGHARWGLVGKVVTPGFEVNDLGIMPRADAVMTAGWIGWNGFKASRAARNWEAWLNGWSGWSMGGERKLLGQSLFARIALHNYWEVEGSVEHQGSAFDVAALRGGPALRTPERLGGWLRISSDPRQSVIGVLSARTSHGLAGDGSGSAFVEPELRARVGLRTQLAVGPSFEWWRNTQQYVATVTGPAREHHIAGDVRQSSAALIVRASHAFTANLTLQLYAQPFVSAGEYRRIGEVVAARAESRERRVRDFSDLTVDGSDLQASSDGATLRFDRPDYTLGELRSNAVLRWQYRPGSALFLVWSQERRHEGSVHPFAPRRQATDLLGRRATNTLLLKISHWIGR